MKVTITAEVDNIEDGARVLASIFGDAAPTKPAAAPKVGKGKKPAEDDDGEALVDDNDGGFGEDDTSNDEPEVSVDDCIKALKAYAGKYDRAAAMKVLKSFKVKSVQDLDEEHYAALLAALKKAPKK